MTAIEIASNDTTIRYLKYKGKCFTRKRDDTTGNYGVYEEHILLDKIQTLKNIYGANGDVVNVSSSFLLRFPSAKKHNVKKVLRDQVLAVFKAYDKTSVLSRFEVDTSQQYDDGVYIYLNVSWAGDDADAEIKSDTLLKNIESLIVNMSTTLPQPFDNVVLSTSLNPVTMICFVQPTILSITTTYAEDTHNTDVEVKTVGLYNHIGIKINKEDDNGFRRLRNQQITTAAEYYDMSNSGGYDNIINIAGVDPTEDTFIATLFDNDYKKLFTSIQTPAIYIQQTQGTHGDLFNEVIEGSITLDFEEFTADNQADFIQTMNSETGGDTTIMNTYTTEGGTIIEYRVTFDVSKTQQEIDDLVVKLNDDVEIQNIINKSATMNGVMASKTAYTIAKRERRLIKQAKIIDVIYDMANSHIVLKTIGSYQHILYKATEQETFESSASKVVDPPLGFTNKVDIKLVDVSGGDITAAETYTFDIISPVITLNGDAEITLAVGEAYVEQGATVTDNSGESITPLISGTADVSTVGTYTITYTATDSSGNTTSSDRIVHVVDTNSPITRFFAGSSSFGAYPNYLFLPNNTLGLTFPEQNLDTFKYLQGSDHKLTYACKFNANTWRAWARLLDISNGTNADEILLKTNASGSVGVLAYSANYEEDSGVNLSTGTDYYLLFTYDRAITSFTLVISTNFDGSSPVVNMTRNNTTFTDGTRTDWYIGISRYAIENPAVWGNEYFDGSITNIAISNSILTWADAFPLPVVISNPDYYDLTNGFLKITGVYENNRYQYSLQGLNKWTVEFWAYITNYNDSSPFAGIVDTRSGFVDMNPGIIFSISPSGQIHTWSQNTMIFSTGYAPLNQWCHIVYQRNAYNNMSFYLNGVGIGVNIALSSEQINALDALENEDQSNTKGEVHIGGLFDNTVTFSYKFYGNIALVEFTKTNKYSTDFTPTKNPQQTDDTLLLLNDYKDVVHNRTFETIGDVVRYPNFPA